MITYRLFQIPEYLEYYFKNVLDGTSLTEWLESCGGRLELIVTRENSTHILVFDDPEDEVAFRLKIGV